jgi:hypothetical protein
MFKGGELDGVGAVPWHLLSVVNRIKIKVLLILR